MVHFKYIMQKKYSAGRVVPIHGHNIYEFVYYVKANGESEYSRSHSVFIADDFSYVSNQELSNRDFYSFTDNTFILIPPQTLHTERHKEAAQVVTFGFSLDDSELVNNLELQSDSGELLVRFIAKILEEYKNRECDYSLRINCLITEMLIEIKRRNSNARPTQSYFLDSISYIDEYYVDDISVSDLAQNAGYCTDHYSFLFKKHMGMSAKQYIIKKRLEKAKNLLLSSNLSIDQISEMCGFKFTSQFIKIFKKYENLTPQKFRKANS